MIRTFKAELLKLRRRRILVAAAVGALAFAVITTTAVLLSAEASGSQPPGRGGATLESLGEPGGAAEAFSTGASFTGILVLVLFIANFAGEFSQGTFRTLLMRQPRRIGLLAGKMAALLVFAAAVLALAAALSLVASLAVAPTQDISTASWLTLDGLAELAEGYGTALVGVAAWASLGAALAVLVRSGPIALGIGIAWSGPIEHLTMDFWNGAAQWFPGLLLEALAAGGSADVSLSHALPVLAVYVTAAVGAAAITFQRRDLTA
jgi:ABC-type transport system involved in multi-copper enzyme maturation permease subunit